jgi:RecA/RadA recombinase
MAPKKKIDTEDVKESGSQDILAAFLKTNKDDHHNFAERVDYTVSSGSMLLDMELGGGFKPGIVRMSGISEGGKTSCALLTLGNHLKTTPNSKGLIIKAEGRLSEEMKSRYDYKFVYTAEEWVVGTVFVFETNVYEAAIDLVRQLVKNNPESIRYFVIIDSMNGLCRREDLVKDSGYNDKVAGSALLTSIFLQKMGAALGRLGHICIFISQVRSSVKIDPYAKVDPKITNASGGNALNHYSDVTLEFQERFKGDIIERTEGGKEKTVGHYCKIIFRKSGNEKTNTLVKYPVKYGRKLGKSVWVELEVFDMLLAWGLLSKGGAWYHLTPELTTMLTSLTKDELPTKFQGQDAVLNWLESNPAMVEFLAKDFKQKISE